jgi:mannose-6-phosphate isomerase-like protein (cupin superfamily)
MKRRTFLTIPFVGTALMANATNNLNTQPTKPFKVDKGKGRGVEQTKVLGSTFDCKVSGKDTNGALCIFDTIREGQGGPPLHLHDEQDEWFYVIKGTFKVQVGEDVMVLNEGDSAFAPRKLPHTFAKTSKGVAQMMIIFQPAGKMEDFFIERASLENEKDLIKKEAALKTLWKRHGMQLVNEPKKI